ncbi:hypothetical protein, partial [Allomesorhizobium camelthorni]|uniref:hypothetical protein n=1 Tax=Allomesorhizobium camelthorni TaxID=475069 RepID=UPI001981B089
SQIGDASSTVRASLCWEPLPAEASGEAILVFCVDTDRSIRQLNDDRGPTRKQRTRPVLPPETGRQTRKFFHRSIGQAAAFFERWRLGVWARKKGNGGTQNVARTLEYRTLQLLRLENLTQVQHACFAG